MRRKNVLILLSIVLIIVSVCMFIACDDKNDNNTNGDNNNDTVNGSQSITLTEGMSVYEVKKALAELKNLTAHYSFKDGGDEYGLTLRIAENGTIRVEHEIECDDELKTVESWYKSAHFIEDNKVYALYIESEGPKEERNYTWRKLAWNDEFETEMENAVEGFLEMAFEEVINGSAEMSIQDGKIIIDFSDDGCTNTYTLYDFNKTTLPIEEYFPDYKTKAVEAEE